LRDQNGYQFFSNGLSKCSLKTRFTTTIEVHQNLALQ